MRTDRTGLRIGNCGLLFAVTATLLMTGTELAAQDKASPVEPLLTPAQRIAEGRKLFLHNWKKDGKVNKTGDGLGPMFNAVSCVACHNQPGVGGAGLNDMNVDLLSVLTPLSNKLTVLPSKTADRVAKRVHPGMTAMRTSLVLHKFGPERPNRKPRVSYLRYRQQIVGTEKSPRLTRDNSVRKIHGVTVRLTQRNTPALFGAGVIDKIPASAFIAAAELQKKNHPRISGRVPQTTSGAVGRFGWRGQSASLHDFVLAACAHELGLEVPGVEQPAATVMITESKRLLLMDRSIQSNSRASTNPFATKSHLDLTASQCRSITAYIASIPAPVKPRGLPLPQMTEIVKGEKLFHKVGCAACHMPKLGPAEGIYSDLLLHDMGRGLTDPVAAVPEMSDKTIRDFITSSSLGGYSGFQSSQQIARITTNIRQEWRTPPLWGVAGTAPYLHDGRAPTVESAILLHAGEGLESNRNYRQLKRKDRQLLLAFLQALTAPDVPMAPGDPNDPFGGIR